MDKSILDECMMLMYRLDQLKAQLYQKQYVAVLLYPGKSKRTRRLAEHHVLRCS